MAGGTSVLLFFAIRRKKSYVCKKKTSQQCRPKKILVCCSAVQLATISVFISADLWAGNNSRRCIHPHLVPTVSDRWSLLIWGPTPRVIWIAGFVCIWVPARNGTRLQVCKRVGCMGKSSGQDGTNAAVGFSRGRPR